LKFENFVERNAKAANFLFFFFFFFFFFFCLQRHSANSRMSLERISPDRICDLIAIGAWWLLPVGGRGLSNHSIAGLFALVLLHVAARVALALVHGRVRAQFTSSSSLSLLVGTVAWLAALVLYGAPLASAHVETLLFALLLACWTVWPPSLALGVSYDQWFALFVRSERPDEMRSFVRRAYAVALGCWLGALVIPLDWDRPWQQWPVSCTYGALAGHVVGTLTL
jgi:phosphatidylinositol glycan class F